MLGQQAVEGSELLHQVRLRAPGQVPGLVHIHLLRGQPLHARGEAEGPVLRGQGAEAVALA